MRRRAWARLAMSIGSGIALFEMGCRGDLIRELDLLTGPESVGALFGLPRSGLTQLFRLLWG